MISKKDHQATNQLLEDYNVATLFTQEDPTQSSGKETNKTLTKELAWITKMSQVLTKLEKKFSIPLEKRKPRMFRRKTKINHIIPKPFRTLFHLLAAPEPDPITVPEPYPVVDWANVRLKPALPNPEAFPVLSASKEPEFYQMQKGLYNSKESSKFSSLEKPFGTLPGYKTTEGVVQVPTNPVYGHIYCPVACKWLLHASLNPVGGRPGGRGCSGTRRGEKERGKKPHSLL